MLFFNINISKKIERVFYMFIARKKHIDSKFKMTTLPVKIRIATVNKIENKSLIS